MVVLIAFAHDPISKWAFLLNMDSEPVFWISIAERGISQSFDWKGFFTDMSQIFCLLSMRF